MAVINPKIKLEDIPKVFTELTDFEHRDSVSETPVQLAKRICMFGCGHACASDCKRRMVEDEFFTMLCRHRGTLLRGKEPMHM